MVVSKPKSAGDNGWMMAIGPNYLRHSLIIKVGHLWLYQTQKDIWRLGKEWGWGQKKTFGLNPSMGVLDLSE